MLTCIVAQEPEHLGAERINRMIGPPRDEVHMDVLMVWVFCELGEIRLVAT
jgi:hypothetical protein